MTNTMARHAGGVLIIFAKPPVAGLVKTRLYPSLGINKTISLYCQLLRHTLTVAVDSCFSNVELWHAGGGNVIFMEALCDEFNISMQQQITGDLGTRMAHAFFTSLSNYSFAVIIGCDCPVLTVADLAKSYQLLQAPTDDAIVLGPTEDGGYYLLGMCHYNSVLFIDIPWGTSMVLTKTRQLIRDLDLCAHELPLRWDVDRFADVVRLRAMGFMPESDAY